MRVPSVTRSRPWGERPDDGDLHVAPLLEGVEPGCVAVFKCLSHRLEQIRPRVLLAPEPLQVHLERPAACCHAVCQKFLERPSGLLVVLG